MSDPPLLHCFQMQRTHRDLIRWALLLRGKFLINLVSRKRRRGDTEAAKVAEHELDCIFDTLIVMKATKQTRTLEAYQADEPSAPAIWTHNPAL